MTTQDASNHHGRWLTIREASLALGTSELTVRRRIKDGKLTSKLEGGKYFVLLAEPSGEQEPDQRTEWAATAERAATPDPAPAAGQLDLAYVFAEQARLAESAGRAALLAEQLRTMEERYAALQEGALALSNRNGWLESKLEEREQEIRLLEDSQHRRSWLRRLFSSG